MATLIRAEAPSALGQWYHVAVTYDRGNLASSPVFYINGQRTATSTLAMPSGTAPPLSGTGYIGNRAALDRAWNGLIDDLRIYNRILTDGEVFALANSPSANVAPVVFAGTNQTILWPASVILTGTVADDGKPNPPGATAITWSRVSGAGTVAFSNPTALSTSASFSAPGSYVLQLAADDGQVRNVSHLVINVIAPPVLSVVRVPGGIRLSWDNSGGQWRLQSQTNGLQSNNWFEVLGSNLTNQMSFPINSANGAVFYRLVQ